MARTKVTKDQSPRKAPESPLKMAKAEQDLLFLWASWQTSPNKSTNPDYKQLAALYGISYNAAVKRYNKLKERLDKLFHELANSTSAPKSDTQEGPAGDTEETTVDT